MGQRLVLTIKNNSKILANSYYHWSAYTDSAAEITNRCIETFKHTKYTNDLDIALEMLASTGAGLTDDEVPEFFRMKAKDPLIQIIPPNALDRDSGLIAVSKKGMENSQGWSEGDVVINIEDKVVDFVVLYYPDDDWLVEYYCDEHNINYDKLDKNKVENIIHQIAEKLPTIDQDISEIKFEDFEEFSNKLYAISGEFLDCEGNIVGKIE